MKNINDDFGVALAVGDHVCWVRKNGRYINNVYGTIVGFTEAGYARILTHDGLDAHVAKTRVFRKAE